jgi:hypothetical protein
MARVCYQGSGHEWRRHTTRLAEDDLQRRARVAHRRRTADRRVDGDRQSGQFDPFSDASPDACTCKVKRRSRARVASPFWQGMPVRCWAPMPSCWQSGSVRRSRGAKSTRRFVRVRKPQLRCSSHMRNRAKDLRRPSEAEQYQSSRGPSLAEALLEGLHGQQQRQTPIVALNDALRVKDLKRIFRSGGFRDVS